MHLNHLNIETRNKANSSEDANKPAKIKISHPSTCVDVMSQLPGRVHLFTNWKIACDCCNCILQGGKKKKKTKDKTLNKDLRCSKHLNNRCKSGIITDDMLKYNLLCNSIDEKLIDNQCMSMHPSKRSQNKVSDATLQRTSSMPKLISSPSLSPLLTVQP